MLDKRGGGWEVNKLITIILLVLVLVVVVAGVVSGGLSPLFNKIGDSFDNILEKLNLAQNRFSEFDGDCFKWHDITEGSFAGEKFRTCTGYCELELIDEEETFKYKDGKLFKADGTDITAFREFNEEQKKFYNEILNAPAELNKLTGFYSAIKKGEEYYFIDEVGDMYKINGNVEGIRKAIRWLIPKKWEYNPQKIVDYSENPWLSSSYSLAEIQQIQQVYNYMKSACR